MSAWVRVTAGGVRWQVRPGCRDLLLGPGGLRLDDWLRAGQAVVVKHGPHRTVYRVALPGLSFYLKHNRLHDRRAWLREWLRPSKARLEWRRAREAAARGVPTFTTLALGEGCGFGPGDSFLLSESIEHAEPLGPFLEQTLPAFPDPRQARLRQRLAAALGELLARLHDAGVRHGDLHAGNLLVRLDGDDRPRLFLIDLHAVRFGRPLGRRARRANLIMLNRWFALRAGRSDRLRFWRAYCRARSVETSALHAETARDLERGTQVSNLRFWKQRDRRCLATNRYYRRVRSAHAAGHVVADLDQSVVASLLADPDGLFRQPGVRLLKDARSSTVAELGLRINGVERRVVYKRFRVTGRGDPWAALVRRPPALRSWVFGHGLRERLLPTPRPLAVLHRRRHGLHYEGYLLTDKVEDAVELRRFADGLAVLPPAERRLVLRRAIDQVARLVRGLHQRGLSHRDLKAANVLVEDGAGPAPRLWLLDLVGVSRPRKLRRRHQVQNLARLHASFRRHPALTRSDKLRFLRVYLQWGLFGRDRWKLWWREIAEATRAKVVRNARTGRPLA